MSQYERMTTDDFTHHLRQVLSDLSANDMLQIPGVYEVLSEHFNNDALDSWWAERESTAEEHDFTLCQECGAFVNPDFADDAPAAHLDAAGTLDDPRSPGDHDDECDVCGYGATR